MSIYTIAIIMRILDDNDRQDQDDDGSDRSRNGTAPKYRVTGDATATAFTRPLVGSPDDLFKTAR